MADQSLPAYLTSTAPVPVEGRAPWFKNVAQTYAGIFLWIAFYDQIAGNDAGPGALSMSGVGACIAALVAAGLISHFLFYVVPGMLGMKTGLPLYIVGTSTFGTKGGYFLPGIFMGLLQIGWYSVATFFATSLVLDGIGMSGHNKTLFGPGAQGFDMMFVILAIVWGYLFAFLGSLGIGMVAKMSTYFPIIPIVMLLVGGAVAFGPLKDYDREQATNYNLAAVSILDGAQAVAEEAAKAEGKDKAGIAKAGAEARTAKAGETADVAALDVAAAAVVADEKKGESNSNWIKGGMKLAGFLLVIQIVIGFFGTAGACGADFCTGSRNKNDVQMGGLVGVAVAILFAGGLAILVVAGAQGAALAGLGAEEGATTYSQLVKQSFGASLGAIAPKAIASPMLILFAIGSVAPACFCSFIIGNSLSTMLAKPNARVAITMAGATIGIVLAALGVAGNLGPFFSLIGASFGPVIGAMAADYVLSGGKWAGPRKGISIPGYGAWLIGFAVGVSNNDLVSGLFNIDVLPGWHPTGVYSLIVGFIVYVVLAKAGLQGETITIPTIDPTAEGSAPAEA